MTKQATSKQAKSKAIYILPLVLFIGIVAFLFSRLGQDTQVQVNTATNQEVPTFSLPNLDEPTQTLTNADLPNEPYLLNVWGSWCIACSREHPFLTQMQQQGVTIVGVNYKDDRDFALDYLKDEGNPYLLNIQDEEGDLGIDLGLTGAPETFVVDGSGVIRQHIVGEITEQNWSAIIQPCFSAVQVGDESKIGQVCQ